MSKDRPTSQTTFLSKVFEKSKLTPAQLLIVVAVFLLGFANTMFGETSSYRNPILLDVTRSTGIALIAAFVTAVIDRNFLVNELQNRISDGIRQATTSDRSLGKVGIEQAIPNFDYGTVFRHAQPGEWVNWLDTYCPSQNEFIEDLKDALLRGVKVRMLIIDAESENAKFRDEELSGTLETGQNWIESLRFFEKRMHLIEQMMHSLASQGMGSFEIRRYHDLPCVPMYLIGGTQSARMGYFSLFLVKESTKCQHIELCDGEWLQDMAVYFDAKWNRQERSPKAVAVNNESPP